jgi:hypothetical protein
VKEKDSKLTICGLPCDITRICSENQYFSETRSARDGVSYFDQMTASKI